VLPFPASISEDDGGAEAASTPKGVALTSSVDASQCCAEDEPHSITATIPPKAEDTPAKCAEDLLRCKQIQPEDEDLYPNPKGLQVIAGALAALTSLLLLARIVSLSTAESHHNAANKSNNDKKIVNEVTATAALCLVTMILGLTISLLAKTTLSPHTLHTLIASCVTIWIGVFVAIALVLEKYQNFRLWNRPPGIAPL